jgi:hypothetical protein
MNELVRAAHTAVDSASVALPGGEKEINLIEFMQIAMQGNNPVYMETYAVFF